MSLGIGSIVSLGGTPGSGTGGGGSNGSGIVVINPGNNLGPAVLFQGVSGVVVTSPSPNVIQIAASGTSNVNKFVASFVGITSGLFTHGLGTLDVIVQVYNDRSPRRQMLPDEIRIENSNQVSVLFNSPQSGRIVIV